MGTNRLKEIENKYVADINNLTNNKLTEKEVGDLIKYIAKECNESYMQAVNNLNKGKRK